MNLFSSIFQLVSEGKLKAYEYIDGYEAFDEDHLIDFKSVLDRFTIMYETVPERDGRQRFVINESDVPRPDPRRSRSWSPCPRSRPRPDRAGRRAPRAGPRPVGPTAPDPDYSDRKSVV